MKYRNKLTLYFGIVIIIPIIFSILFSFFYFRKILNIEYDGRLVECAEAVGERFESIEKNILKKIKYINLSNELKDYYNIQDRKQFLENVIFYKQISEFDIIEIGDNNGKVLVRGHNPQDWGDIKISFPIIKKGLSGKTVVDFETGNKGIAIRCVTPIISDDKIIGTLMAGYYLDDDLANSYKQLTSKEIGFYFKDKEYHSTFPKLNNFNVDNYIDLEIDEIKLINFESNHQTFRAAVRGIFQNQGDFIGVLLAGKDKKIIEKHFYKNINILLINVLSTVVIAFIVVIIISKNVTKPLDKYIKYMNEIGKGNFNIRLTYENRFDEFDFLEKNFNNMANKLEEISLKLFSTQNELIKKEKLALAGNLTTEIAHEIRNPLNSMAANIELLKTDIQKDKSTKILQRLNILKETIKKLNKIISKFLTETSPVNIMPARHNLIKLLKKSIDIIKSLGAVNKIEIDFNSDVKELFVIIDAELLQNVFFNILKNAFEAMPDGGKLFITVRTYDKDVQILFKDSGAGLLPKEQKRIFEPYYTTKNTGSGIGLSFAARVVEAHNGKIRCDSLINKGTEITIVLPLKV
jgi:signal transduction histidine kinase